MQHYDLLVLGHVSKDINISLDGEERLIGGAVLYGAIAAKRAGAQVLALTKLAGGDLATLDGFAQNGVHALWRPSAKTTSIRNTYHTADRERRTCEAISIADPFALADLPADVSADVYYMGGLIKGEFPEAFVLAMAERGKVAVDVQGFLRVSENGPMVFRDWDCKRDIISRIHYLKTDAAEAEILTGLSDVAEAARTLRGWGAAEVVLTHNRGVLVCADSGVHGFPWTSRNLSGRTGRGDTCFSSYCAWRIHHTPEESVRFAAALTSLKMETPGPFRGTVADVETVLSERPGY